MCCHEELSEGRGPSKNRQWWSYRMQFCAILQSKRQHKAVRWCSPGCHVALIASINSGAGGCAQALGNCSHYSQVKCLSSTRFFFDHWEERKGVSQLASQGSGTQNSHVSAMALEATTDFDIGLHVGLIYGRKMEMGFIRHCPAQCLQNLSLLQVPLTTSCFSFTYLS